MKNRLSQNKGVLVLLLVVLLGLMGMGEVFSRKFLGDIIAKFGQHLKRGEQRASSTMLSPWASGAWFYIEFKKPWGPLTGASITGIRNSLYKFDAEIAPRESEVPNVKEDDPVFINFGTTQAILQQKHRNEKLKMLIAKDVRLEELFFKFKELLGVIKNIMGKRGSISRDTYEIYSTENREASLRLALRKAKTYMKDKKRKEFGKDRDVTTDSINKFEKIHNKKFYQRVSTLLVREKIMFEIILSIAQDIEMSTHEAYFEKVFGAFMQRDMTSAEQRERYAEIAKHLEVDINENFWAEPTKKIELDKITQTFTARQTRLDVFMRNRDRFYQSLLYQEIKDIEENWEIALREIGQKKLDKRMSTYKKEFFKYTKPRTILGIPKGLKNKTEFEKWYNKWDSKLRKSLKKKNYEQFDSQLQDDAEQEFTRLYNETQSAFESARTSFVGEFTSKREEKETTERKDLLTKIGKLKAKTEKIEDSEIKTSFDKQLETQRKLVSEATNLTSLDEMSRIIEGIEQNIEEMVEEKGGEEETFEEIEEEKTTESESIIEKLEREKKESAERLKKLREKKEALKKTTEEKIKKRLEEIEAMAQKKLEATAKLAKQVEETIVEKIAEEEMPTEVKSEERLGLELELNMLQIKANELSKQVDEEVAAVEAVLASLKESSVENKERLAKRLTDPRDLLVKFRNELITLVEFDDDTTNKEMTQKARKGTDELTEIDEKLTSFKEMVQAVKQKTQ